MYIHKRTANLNLRISPELKQSIKERCQQLDISVNNYMLRLAQKDLKENGFKIERPDKKSDKFWTGDIEDMPLVM